MNARPLSVPRIEAPSDWVARFADLVPRGAHVLDVACGRGRHSLYFAARGCVVDAVDRDPDCAAAFVDSPAVRFVAADIEGGPWPYAGRAFDVIVVTHYLFRPLLPILRDSLAEGGLLLYETFASGQQRFGRPTNPDFLLRPGELLDVFRPPLAVIAFEDLVVHRPEPARVQRIAACRGPLPDDRPHA
jgi:SAM-dependent methyltransferase